MGAVIEKTQTTAGAKARSYLENSVQYLPGVGPARAKHLSALGIQTVKDLVEYFPFRHQLIPKSIPIGSLTEGITATLVGEIHRIHGHGRRGDKTVYAEMV